MALLFAHKPPRRNRLHMASHHARTRVAVAALGSLWMTLVFAQAGGTTQGQPPPAGQGQPPPAGRGRIPRGTGPAGARDRDKRAADARWITQCTRPLPSQDVIVAAGTLQPTACTRHFRERRRLAVPRETAGWLIPRVKQHVPPFNFIGRRHGDGGIPPRHLATMGGQGSPRTQPPTSS